MFWEKHQDSIEKRVTNISRFISITLIALLCINLGLMLYSQIRHDNFIVNMGDITDLKPDIQENISAELWEVIAGRQSFENCKAYEMIDKVELTTRANENDVEDDVELVMVNRITATMRQYVGRIEYNMKNDVSIAESEKLLSDLRDVCEWANDMLDGYLTKQISKEGNTSRTERMIFFSCFFVEIMLWFLVIRFSNKMSQQLKKFIKINLEKLETFAAKIAGGELNARAPVKTVDELVPLTESMNEMADQLNKLIEQNKREQQNLKKSELRTLQAQINPHFLYNTLDAIMWQAEAKNSDEVIRITRALSDFFRISLSAGEEWITVAQEVKHLEGYLSIQKVRYRDIMNYSIDIEPEIENITMLKLLLQPLVENALYHGIKPKRGGGSISVTGRRDGEELVFCVADTGIGIPPYKLREIEEHMRSDDAPIKDSIRQGSGFGLRNVDLRIRLYYNQPNGLKIESDMTGCRVSFRVPVNAKGRENV